MPFDFLFANLLYGHILKYLQEERRMSLGKYQVHDETSQVSYTTSSIYEVGLLTNGRLLCFVLSDSVVYPLFPIIYRGIFV